MRSVDDGASKESKKGPKGHRATPSGNFLRGLSVVTALAVSGCAASPTRPEGTTAKAEVGESAPKQVSDDPRFNARLEKDLAESRRISPILEQWMRDPQIAAKFSGVIYKASRPNPLGFDGFVYKGPDGTEYPIVGVEHQGNIDKYSVLPRFDKSEGAQKVSLYGDFDSFTLKQISLCSVSPDQCEDTDTPTHQAEAIDHYEKQAEERFQLHLKKERSYNSAAAQLGRMVRFERAGVPYSYVFRGNVRGKQVEWALAVYFEGDEMVIEQFKDECRFNLKSGKLSADEVDAAIEAAYK